MYGRYYIIWTVWMILQAIDLIMTKSAMTQINGTTELNPIAREIIFSLPYPYVIVLLISGLIFGLYIFMFYLFEKYGNIPQEWVYIPIAVNTVMLMYPIIHNGMQLILYIH